MDGQDGQDLKTEGGHSCPPPRRMAGPPRNDGEISGRFIVIVIVIERKGVAKWWNNGMVEGEAPMAPIKNGC